MIKIATAQLWVHDQDEALAFYTEKVGMEVRADVTLAEMGDFRWLTVGPAGQEDVAIVLMAIPGPPVMDDETAEQVRDADGQGLRRHGVPRPRTTARRPTRSSQPRGVEFIGAPGGAAVRHRLRVPRPVRQHHPPHPGPRPGDALTMRRGGLR